MKGELLQHATVAWGNDHASGSGGGSGGGGSKGAVKYEPPVRARGVAVDSKRLCMAIMLSVALDTTRRSEPSIRFDANMHHRLICDACSSRVSATPLEQGVPGIGLSLQPTVSMSASIHDPGALHESLASACCASTMESSVS